MIVTFREVVARMGRFEAENYKRPPLYMNAYRADNFKHKKSVRSAKNLAQKKRNMYIRNLTVFFFLLIIKRDW